MKNKSPKTYMITFLISSSVNPSRKLLMIFRSLERSSELCLPRVCMDSILVLDTPPCRVRSDPKTTGVIPKIDKVNNLINLENKKTNTKLNLCQFIAYFLGNLRGNFIQLIESPLESLLESLLEFLIGSVWIPNSVVYPPLSSTQSLLDLFS